MIKYWYDSHKNKVECCEFIYTVLGHEYVMVDKETKKFIAKEIKGLKRLDGGYHLGMLYDTKEECLNAEINKLDNLIDVLTKQKESLLLQYQYQYE